MPARAFEDLSNRTFTRLLVLRFSHVRASRRYWLVTCACSGHSPSKSFTVRETDLLKGGSRSCGCTRRESLAARSTRHSHTTSPTYQSWRAMTRRCYDKKYVAYRFYGARGVVVDDRWRGREGFTHFLADMGERPNGTTLDRRDVNGPYSPENCRWADGQTQFWNRRTTVDIKSEADEYDYWSQAEEEYLASHVADR